MKFAILFIVNYEYESSRTSSYLEAMRTISFITSGLVSRKRGLRTFDRICARGVQKGRGEYGPGRQWFIPLSHIFIGGGHTKKPHCTI